MTVFEELNNFTGVVALYSALNSSSVYRLKSCWEVRSFRVPQLSQKLDTEKQSKYGHFKELCNPHWTEMIETLRKINPPCVPFFGSSSPSLPPRFLTATAMSNCVNKSFVTACLLCRERSVAQFVAVCPSSSSSQCRAFRPLSVQDLLLRRGQPHLRELRRPRARPCTSLVVGEVWLCSTNTGTQSP